MVVLHGQQHAAAAAGKPPAEEQGFRFKSGVELINVTATVSDASGRFVPVCGRTTFSSTKTTSRWTVTHFSTERVPVSLGIVVDTSGSMAGEKIEAARSALDRFLFELLDKHDEIFLYRFSHRPDAAAGMDPDRTLLTRRAQPDRRRTAGRRCTTPSPRRSRWRSRARIGRRRSS